MARITLRPFRDEDLPGLVALYQRAYAEHPEYGEATREASQRYLEWLQRHHTFFQVAEDDAGRIVGFIVAHANWRDRDGQRVGEIHELVVDPAYWGHGLGGRLLDAALEHFKAHGHQRARLWVGEHNDRARAFYARHGFRPVRPGYWVRMEKRL